MTDETPAADTLPRPFFVSIGVFLAACYWVFEAYFDSVLIDETTFMARLMPSDANELWMRSLVSLLFVGFGLYAHRAHVRMKAARKLNVDAARLLENAISNTIRGRFAICANCQKIRDENEQWVAPDRFIAARTEAEFLRIVCDECQAES